MKKCDKASASIILAGELFFFLKMLITLELHGTFGSNFNCFCILTLPSHRYEKIGDEASPSIIFAGRALLVKMLIILELRYAFGSNFEYFIVFFFFFTLFYLFLFFFLFSFYFFLFFSFLLLFFCVF